MNTPLRRARLKRGWTLQQVATIVGIDVGNLSRIERGLQVPAKQRIKALIELYDEVTAIHVICPELFLEDSQPEEQT